MVVSPTTRFGEPTCTFGEVQEIYVVNSAALCLYVEILCTEEYCHHYLAYVAKHTQTYRIHIKQFVSHVPLHLHKICSLQRSVCIIPKFILK